MAEHELKITIGTKSSLARAIASQLLLMSSILIIPAVNNLLLGGGWAIDLIGGAMGLFVFATVYKSLGLIDTTKTFATAQEAADWVASEDWRGAK